MTARRISIEAYHRHLESGKALTQWQRIYEWLYTYYGPVNYNPEAFPAYEGCTRAELAEKLHLRVSSVCGRVKELLDAGMIEELPRRKCTVTGDMAHPLTVKRGDVWILKKSRRGMR